MEDPQRRQRRARHAGGPGGVARILRTAALTALIAAAAFTAAGLFYGDPRFVGLFQLRNTAVPNGQAEDQHPGTAPEGVSSDAPPPGLEEADSPLGAAEEPPLASDSFKFLAINDDGSPVGYSPCRPLHYVVNAGQAPAGSEDLVEEAIGTISRATGIRFVNDGPSTETPAEDRDPYQPEAYGERWAPLLISWTTPDASAKLKGQVIGTGGSTHYSFDGGPKTFVTGSLDLDAPQIALELERPQGSAYATAVILHELAHVMGLEHVDDPLQLMYPEIGAPDGLAAGDLNGLYQLGKTACRKDL
ncbi:matrixin family metalloprotease [Arthrobacter sp. B10-11]|uniref:matrixin family metalloprotease n=1 Tax=Arthrobacter sp. B10-11 TaxID=3081160 RepID=UPI0029559877|nr:matrixin family metalloprotease [Arthrobacter sp. B10-11]MDV8149566.1 matrixin family metalloprotease [Arthrobacter sp. B10-11]